MELQQLKQHHSLILNSVGEGIFGLNAQGVITFANPAATTILGYGEGELIGQLQHPLIHHTRANGTPYPLDLCPIAASMRDGITRSSETDVFWTKQGTSIPVAYTSTPLREHDVIVGAVIAFQDITERKRIEARQTTQFAVTRVMAEAESIRDAVPGLLQAICVGMDWDLGELWYVDRDAQVLRRLGGWYALTVHAVDFEIGSRHMTFAKEQGLPGQVWASGQASWITNVITESGFMRAELAADHGLYTAFAVPVRNGREVIGVLVCFSRAMRRRNDDLLQLMADISSQIGQYIERRQAEAAVERSATRLATLHQIDGAILAAESPREIALAALRHLWQFVPYHQASVAMRNGAADTSVVLATIDRMSLTQPVALEQMPFSQLTTDQPNNAPSTFTLQVPLIAHESEIGELNIVGAAGHSFNDEQRAVLREVAAQLAVALQQARLFEQVRTGNERLHTLSAHLLEVQEQERRHIARELHDEIGQALTAAQLNLQDLTEVTKLEALPARVEDTLVLIETVLGQVRSLSLDLRPSMLDDLGLGAALRWYVKRQAERAKLMAEINADAIEPRPPTTIETACYRIAQEAVTNIVRYARATEVCVDLYARSGVLHLVVRDNGVGFDVDAAQARASQGGSVGILGMQERAQLAGGWWSVASTPGQGTTIRAFFPLHPAERSDANDVDSHHFGR